MGYPTGYPTGYPSGYRKGFMKTRNIKRLVTFSEALLEKIDRRAKKENKNRSELIAELIEAKMFADEMREAYQ
jgi:hypothetical protein